MRFGSAGVKTADYAMRKERYKLLRIQSAEEFYDLAEDPYEHNYLLASGLTEHEQTEYRSLERRLLEVRSSE